MLHLKNWRLLPVLFLALLFSACEIDDQISPNGPSLDSVLTDASEGELNLLVTGIESRIRNGFGTYVTASGSIARELYVFDADPRNTSDLLGKEDAVLDGNTFYLTAPYATRYRVVKNANILLEAVDNANASVTAAQRDGYRGFANTMKALMLSQVLDLLGDNGIRFDVDNPDNLGPFLSREAAYDAILSLFDTANDQLDDAEFAFTLSSGFSGFNTAETFSEVNRGLAARVATRAGRYERALDLVEDSFLNLDFDATDRAALLAGPQHVFGNAPDLLNPLFKQAGQSGDQIIVHPRIIDSIAAGDNRINKFRLRAADSNGGQDGLNGSYETALYASATAPIDIIRNEELVLIWAEANLQTGDLDDAERGLNVIRSAAGLDDIDSDDRDELIDELLYNRTYSLWGEGHQMFDLRRYGRLNANFLPLDRTGDDIFMQFPIPLSEGV